MQTLEPVVGRLKVTNTVSVRVSPLLVVVFALLTIADGLNIYRCGWFWTSMGAVVCPMFPKEFKKSASAHQTWGGRV